MEKWRGGILLQPPIVMPLELGVWAYPLGDQPCLHPISGMRAWAVTWPCPVYVKLGRPYDFVSGMCYIPRVITWPWLKDMMAQDVVSDGNAPYGYDGPGLWPMKKGQQHDPMW